MPPLISFTFRRALLNSGQLRDEYIDPMLQRQVEAARQVFGNHERGDLAMWLKSRGRIGRPVGVRNL
jgi:hypothetical protein